MSHLSCCSRGKEEYPPLFFLHGFLGCKEDWKSIINVLYPNYHCIAIDLPGHGKSVIGEDPLEQIVSSIKEQADKPVCLIGYSLGGRIAMMIDERYPELIRKKIILSAHPGLSSLDDKQERLESDEKWAKMLEEHPIDYFLEKWYAQALFFSLRRNKKLYQQTLAKRKLQDRFALAKMLRTFSLGKQATYRKFQDTLFLYGEHDKKFATLYHRLIPSAPMVTISDASHAIHLENPSGCAEVLQKFLGDLNECQDSNRMEVRQNL